MLLTLLLQVAAAPPSPWYKEPVTIAVIINTACTILYVIATIRLVSHARQSTEATKQIAEAAHRPYIGVWNITASRNPEIRQTHITAEIHNAGNVPAYEFKLQVGLKRNNIPQQIREVKGKYSMVHPQMPITSSIVFQARDEGIEPLILEVNGLLILTVTADYKGVAEKTYHYEYEARYNEEWKCFAVFRESST